MQFDEIPSFSKELKRLQKRYRSLPKDILSLKSLLERQPEGNESRHWRGLHKSESLAVFKMRLACASLHSSDMRLVYAYHPGDTKIVFIELYFKGDKANEDRELIKEYILRAEET